MKTILIDNLVINYNIYWDINTNKIWILCLHGWWDKWATFESLVNEFDLKKYYFICPDFPWFGNSTRPGNNRWVKEYSDLIYKFLDKLKIEKTIVIAHSFWWRITIEISANNPNFFKKIVLIWSAWIKPSTNYFKTLISRFWKLIFSLPILKIFYNKIKSIFSSRDYKSAWEMKQIFLNTISYDQVNLLEKITNPTLLIRWENDSETPISDWEIMNKKIRNSSLINIPGGSHFVFREFPKEVSSYIQDFIIDKK